MMVSINRRSLLFGTAVLIGLVALAHPAAARRGGGGGGGNGRVRKEIRLAGTSGSGLKGKVRVESRRDREKLKVQVESRRHPIGTQFSVYFTNPSVSPDRMFLATLTLTRPDRVRPGEDGVGSVGELEFDNSPGSGEHLPLPAGAAPVTGIRGVEVEDPESHLVLMRGSF